MKNRVFLFLLLAFLNFAVPAKASDVWLGLAGAGEGAGSFGHTFLVFSDYSPMFGQVISYTLGNLAAKTSGKESMMFIEEYDFSAYKSIYNIAENRTVTLFKLNLTQAEALRLKELTQAELNQQKSGKSALKYEVTSSNCLTHLIDLINTVVSVERKIPIESLIDSLQPGLEMPYEAAINFLNRIPLWMSKYIPQSAIYAGESMQFDDFNTYRIKLTTGSLENLFSDIKQCNSVSDSMISAMKEMTLFVQKNQPYFEKYKFDNYFKRLTSCSKDKIFYKEFLLIVYNGINPVNKAYRSQINSLIAEQK